jgi:hypothetical protein
MDIAPERFHALVDAFGLAVGLRMVAGAHRQGDLEQFK